MANEIQRRANAWAQARRQDPNIEKGRIFQLDRTADTGTETQNAAELLEMLYQGTEVQCARILGALEGAYVYNDPPRRDYGGARDIDDEWTPTGSRAGRPAPQASAIRITQDAVRDLLAQYDDLSFKRMRCYFRKSAASTTVIVYDIIIPTWKGVMLMDPRSSYTGDPKLWFGYRPASAGRNGTSPITVLKPSQLPVTGPEHPFLTDQYAGKVFRAEKFEYRRPAAEGGDPEWREGYDISKEPKGFQMVKEFVSSTENLVEEIGEASRDKDAPEIADLLDILDGVKKMERAQLEGRRSGPSREDAPEATRPGQQPSAGQAGGPAKTTPPRRGGPAPDDIDKVL